MTIYQKTEALLSTLFDRYFHGFPDFGEGQEPDTYVVYTALHRPAHFVSGKKTADNYLVTLEIFTPLFDDELYTKVEKLFTDDGFIFSESRELDFGGEFPQRTRYSMDFLIYIDI